MFSKFRTFRAIIASCNNYVISQKYSVLTNLRESIQLQEWTPESRCQLWFLPVTLPMEMRQNICGGNKARFIFRSRTLSARARTTGWDREASPTRKSTWNPGPWTGAMPWTPVTVPVWRSPECHGHHPFKDLNGENMIWPSCPSKQGVFFILG